MCVINFSGARKRLKQVIDQVVANAVVTVISRRDAPDAVVMSRDTYNSMVETTHLLKVPANAAHLARSVSQFRKHKMKEPVLSKPETLDQPGVSAMQWLINQSATGKRSKARIDAELKTERDW
jgi:antitoxin YefM